MRITALSGAALAAVLAAPAAADNGQVFDAQAQREAYASGGPSLAQCFNGTSVAAANRAGARTLFVQPARGGVYTAQLAGDCEALDLAEKIAVRSAGGDVVCPRRPAELLVQTPAGQRQCGLTKLRKLSPRELSALASAPRR